MKRVTEQIAQAFLRGETKVVGNTETDGTCVWLFGNKIAEKVEESNIRVTLAGYPTPTTRERVNGLCDICGTTTRRFFQSKGQQFFGDLPVDDYEWVNIS